MRPFFCLLLVGMLAVGVASSYEQTPPVGSRSASGPESEPDQRAPLIADASRATNVWHERAVASVSIGFDKTADSYIFRQYLAQVFGPPKPRNVPANEGRNVCSKRGLDAMIERLLPGLRSIRPLRPTGHLNDEDDKKRRAAYDAAVTRVVRKSVDEADRTAAICLAEWNLKRNLFAFSLVLRDCDKSNAACKSRPGIFADEEEAKFFGDLSDWMDARNGVQPTTGVNYSVAIPPSDIARGILPGANMTALIAHCKARPNSDNCDRVATLVQPVVQPERGPIMEPRFAQPRFEQLVEKARLLKKRVEGHVPRTIAVPQEVAIRVIDALDDPMQAMRNLASIPNASLMVIQDELARARIRDCSLFLAKAPAEVGDCAGYVVADNVLLDCIGGRECVPPLNANGKADVLMNLATGSMSTLATMNQLPRLQGIKLSEIQERGGDCFDRHKPPPNPTDEQLKPIMTCLGDLTFSGPERAISSCFQMAPNDWEQARKCLNGSPLAKQLPEEAQQVLDCAKFQQAGQGVSDSALCLLKDRIPKPARMGIACLQGSGGQAVETCLSQLVEGDAKILKDCWVRAQGNWEGAAMCAMEKELSGKVPHEVAQAFRCTVDNGTAAGIGTCMVRAGIGLGSLPPWQQKLVQCAGESSGDPLGTTVCMAVNDGLTADQRIALQCLASTGGEMSAAATCAIGRMALKEFANCADRPIGDGPCFGKNNEIVKLLAAIGIDVSSTTVVGQLLNVPLDMFKQQIKVAQGFIGVAGAVVSALPDIALNVATVFGRTAADLVQGAGQVAGAVFGGALGVAGQVIEVFGGAASGIGRVFGF